MIMNRYLINNLLPICTLRMYISEWLIKGTRIEGKKLQKYLKITEKDNSDGKKIFVPYDFLFL